MAESCVTVRDTGDIVESSFRGTPIQYLKSALSVNTHYGCNLGCIYCVLSAHGFPERPKKIVTAEDAVRLLYESGYPIETGMPIAINNKSEPLHGDVKRDTFRVMELLAQRGLRNPIQIISKLGYDDSDLRYLQQLGLNLYHFTSYSALPRTIEPLSGEIRLKTMEQLAHRDWLKSVHYWRPIIEGANDSVEEMTELLDFVARHCDATLVSGIKLPRTVIKNLREQAGVELEYDYLNTEIKRLDPDVFRAMARISHERYPDFPLFRHTSCVFSYFEGYPDYWNNYTFGDSNCNPHCPKQEECTGDHFPPPELIEREIRRFSDGPFLPIPQENLIFLPDDITLDKFSHLLFALRARVARRKDLYLMWDLNPEGYEDKFDKMNKGS